MRPQAAGPGSGPALFPGGLFIFPRQGRAPKLRAAACGVHRRARIRTLACPCTLWYTFHHTARRAGLKGA
ncbi:MAG: hypothetical protein DBY17_02360 [Oscillospiraceae bacterium]|nr:MAG: hypothetical protein DBY17_02360 [Oscillospiraceae bacterium]